MKVIPIGKYEIIFTDEVSSLLYSFRQFKKRHPESGGILLGQVKGKRVYVTRISFPSKHDTSSRTSFIRDKDKAQLIIDYEFINSEKQTTYLGEWHTHPEEVPSPSTIDRLMITDQFKKNKLNEPFVLQYIQGTRGFYLGLITFKNIDELRVREIR